LYDAGSGGTAESFKLVLEGVESRSPQTDFFASEDFGSRIFWQPAGADQSSGWYFPGAYVQYFNKSVFTDTLTGNGSGLTSVNAATATVVDGSDSTSFVVIVDSATGNLPIKTDTAR